MIEKAKYHEIRLRVFQGEALCPLCKRSFKLTLPTKVMHHLCPEITPPGSMRAVRRVFLAMGIKP